MLLNTALLSHKNQKLILSTEKLLIFMLLKLFGVHTTIGYSRMYGYIYVTALRSIVFKVSIKHLLINNTHYLYYINVLVATSKVRAPRQSLYKSKNQLKYFD